MTVTVPRVWERREIEDVFRGRYSELVRLAYYLTSDRAAAEELVQEAFVRLWGNPRALRDAAAMDAYVRSTVVNLCRHAMRRRRLERRTAPEFRRGDDVDIVGVLDLHAALRALPSRKRACVVLRYFSDLSEAETAAVLGVSIGTVKSQTSKALAQLAGVLAVDPNTPERSRDGSS